MLIHGQLATETCEQIKAGAVTEFPLGDDFIRTEGGVISSQELLVLIWQTFKGNPFIITIEATDKPPIANPLHREFLSDKLQER